MSLDPAAVRRLAVLSRIHVTDAEALAASAELNAIFVMIERMQAVDTAGVAPMAHAQDVVLTLRPDVVTEADQREAFQAVAPRTERGLYLVPRVIE